MPLSKATFHDLCHMDLNGTEWDSYYQSMSPYLTYDDPDIREQCIERLCRAVFWSEGSNQQDERPTTQHMCKCTEWVLNLFLKVHKTHADTLPTVLKTMRYDFPYHTDQRQMVLDWLGSLLETPRPNVRPDIISGTIVLHQIVSEKEEQAQFFEWIKLLDNPSDYVRACAAYRIGGVYDEGQMPVDDLLELIKQKDIERPGIAGAFWSEAYYNFEDNTDFAMNWMMDILEQRTGPMPKDAPFNDIVFHLHEICDHSPDIVRRMIKSGHVGLAIETALETDGVVKGMAPVLRELGWNKQITHAIARHLACHYQEVHPNANPQDIKRLPDWRQDADLFLLQFFQNSTHFDCAVIYCTTDAGYFTDKRAWSIVDKILPPKDRGFLRNGFLTFKPHLPPKPEILGDKASYYYEGYHSVTLHGDPTNRLWSKITLHGCHLTGFEGL